MAVTHFIITKLPDASKVISKLGLDDVQLNTLYPIADQNTLNFQRVGALDGYYVKEFFLYKTYDEVLDLYSNEATGNIIFKESDNQITPASADFQETLLNDNSVILLNKLPINTATEFIEITGIEGVNELNKDGQRLSVGDQIEVDELLESTFTTLSEGGGAPYFVLSYKVGKGVTLESTVYTYTVDVVSLAEISLVSQEAVTTNQEFLVTGQPQNYDVVNEIILIEVAKGYQQGTAEIQVIINSPFLTASDPELQSEISINGNTEIIKTANETFNITLSLNKLGKAGFSITNYIIKEDPVETGEITLNLLNINGDPALVSGTNSVIINTNV